MIITRRNGALERVRKTNNVIVPEFRRFTCTGHTTQLAVRGGVFMPLAFAAPAAAGIRGVRGRAMSKSEEVAEVMREAWSQSLMRSAIRAARPVSGSGAAGGDAAAGPTGALQPACVVAAGTGVPCVAAHTGTGTHAPAAAEHAATARTGADGWEGC